MFTFGKSNANSPVDKFDSRVPLRKVWLSQETLPKQSGLNSTRRRPRIAGYLGCKKTLNLHDSDLSVKDPSSLKVRLSLKSTSGSPRLGQIYLEGELFEVQAHWHLQVPCKFNEYTHSYEADVTLEDGAAFRFFALESNAKTILMSDEFP